MAEHVMYVHIRIIVTLCLHQNRLEICRFLDPDRLTSKNWLLTSGHRVLSSCMFTWILLKLKTYVRDFNVYFTHEIISPQASPQCLSLQFTSAVFTKAEVLLTMFWWVIIAPLGFPKKEGHQDSTVKFRSLTVNLDPNSCKTNVIAFFDINTFLCVSIKQNTVKNSWQQWSIKIVMKSYNFLRSPKPWEITMVLDMFLIQNSTLLWRCSYQIQINFCSQSVL